MSQSQGLQRQFQVIPVSGQDILSVQQMSSYFCQVQTLLLQKFAFLCRSSLKAGVRAKSTSHMLKHPDTWLWGKTRRCLPYTQHVGHPPQPWRDACGGFVLTVGEESFLEWLQCSLCICMLPDYRLSLDTLERKYSFQMHPGLQAAESDLDEGKGSSGVQCQVKAAGKTQEWIGHEATTHIQGPSTAIK